MPLTPERKAAQQQLEAAIEAMITAYGSFDEGQVYTGHVLVVMGTRFMDPELDADYYNADDGDETESVSTHRTFVKRGQLPVMTRGLLECVLDRWK